MNFDLKKTAILQAVRRDKFFIFKLASFFKSLFLFLFIFSLILFLASFVDLTSGRITIKMTVLFFVLFLGFWDLFLFKEIKIKKPEISGKLSDVISNLDEYNLAEFLSFGAAKIIDDSIKFCAKKRIGISSTALFYSCIHNWLASS